MKEQKLARIRAKIALFCGLLTISALGLTSEQKKTAPGVGLFGVSGSVYELTETEYRVSTCSAIAKDSSAATK